MTAAPAQGNGLQVWQPEVVSPGESRRPDIQRIAFWLCCAYVISQVYLVPIWPIGPSWSVWPCITDFVIVLMLVALPFLSRANVSLCREVAGIERLLLILGIGCVLSYLVLTLNLSHIRSAETFNDKGQSVGMYQLYRLLQYFIVFWFASRVEMDAAHAKWLCWVVGMTFWVSSAFLLADYFGLVDTPTLAPHISKDLMVAGPWAFYSRGIVGQPVGTIGFHHVYPCIQLLVLGALYLHLISARRTWLVALVLGCLWTCSFVSGSRAGFVAVSILTAVVAFTHLRRFLAVAVLVAVATVPLMFYSDSLLQAFANAIERQSTIGESYETDGLAGRVDIWNERLDLLNENAVFWLIGTGFGSAIETGENSHMLYLHITLECGLVGLSVFVLLAWRVAKLLWQRESGLKAMYLATLVLLVSALTQETFYPVPALSHFLGMYLFCVAVTLRMTVGSATAEV